MTRLLFLFALVAPMAHAQQILASYQDRNRVLLLFAPDAKDPVYQEQLGMLSHRDAELKERDLIVLPVLVHPTPPVTANTLRVTLGPGLSDEEQIIVRRRFDIAPERFTVVLIGKDGGEKFRSEQPVTEDKLNTIIDGMPMRQDEMRAKTHSR